ncbi:hypothetical protein HYW94_02785 [Candidatus Uhrbacteria bacterium]|nr:hypothetical protein [Candidatus Uhrbacteria bacterium]
MENTSSIPNIAKATRQELMDGYRALLKKYKDTSARNVQEQPIQKDIAMAAVHQYVGEADIRAHMGTLRTHIHTALSDIETTLFAKFTELKNFDEALMAQKTKLQELYEIEESAGALIALMQSRHEATHLAENEKTELEQKRKRDEDEYAFTLALQKRKDKENYEAEKRKLELELDAKMTEFEEQRKIFTAKEADYHALRAQVEEFPKTLQKEKQKMEEQLLAAATKDKEMALLLATKEAEAEKTVLEGKIQALQTGMEECKKLITSLQEQLKTSYAQTQEVVLKSIESAAGAKTLEAVNKLALEQTRAPGGRN